MRNTVKRWISRALLLALLLCLAPAAQAADTTPTVRYTPVSGGATVLSVADFPTDVYAAQLTLTLEGSCTPQFQAGDAAAYQTVPAPTHDGDRTTTVTLYLVSGDLPLNRNGVLTLGTLRVGGEETLRMPAQATLQLLDASLATAFAGTVQTQEHRPAAPGGGGGGGVAVVPPEEETPAALPFADVAEDDWFYAAVRFVYEKGMMSGTKTDAFAPETPTTRGMIVAILYRLEGSPVAGLSDFPDVPDHQYYARPIAWAVRNGIVSGYPNGTFAPEQPITREQMTSILFRYAEYKGWSTAARADLGPFRDADDANSYAVASLEWANAVGLIQGVREGVLLPQGRATRAQTAAILMRFCESVAAAA